MSSTSRVGGLQLLALVVLFAFAVQARAQNNEGNNAIFSNSSGTIVGSGAYIDAYPFFSNGC
jgi:hypothetical protein